MKQFFHVARIVLEATSPLMIASGERDVNLDVLLARDVNNLPMLPATGIAGVVRALARDDARFGRACRMSGNRASDVTFSDGLIHLSDDKPRDGIMFTLPEDDGLWSLYQQPNPVQRDHVKLDQFGTAENMAKFQRGAVPSGSRFSCEISMLSGEKDDPDFDTILNLFHHPLFGLLDSHISVGTLLLFKNNGLFFAPSLYCPESQNCLSIVNKHFFQSTWVQPERCVHTVGCSGWAEPGAAGTEP